jgi:methylthioribose-1-phosphate isomerase
MNVTLRGRTRHFRTVTFDAATNEVVLIEQRRLPHEFTLVRTRDFRETAAAIRDMIVRGAPAIAATAAYGLAQGARAFRGQLLTAFAGHLRKVYETIEAARPTAVDPVNAMNEVLAAMQHGVPALAGQESSCTSGGRLKPGLQTADVPTQQALALAAAEEFASQSVRECEAIGRHGAKLIRNGANVLTHCNAGWLACVDVGTATAPMYAAQAAGRKFHVFCDETRPRCQGASLTAWELAQQGVPHHVIADNAAGHLMQRGEIDLVIVGSDRTLGRTGDVANKIGTYTKAVLAKRHGIPFYVAIPLSTLDWNLKSGSAIPIEERQEEEVLGAWGLEVRSAERGVRNDRRTFVRVANPTSPARNPGFDVTPAELVTGIITPRGIFKPQELWRRRAELQAR